MLEFTPSKAHKKAINECFRCRGMLISSYAHVEFLLGDLCLKSWQLAPYRSLANRLPYKANTRERAVSAILSVENGPLFEFRRSAEPLLKRWRESESDRNMMAHGLMTLEWMKNGEIFVRGTLLKAGSNVHVDVERIRWSLGTLQSKASQASSYSQAWMKLCHAMHSKMGWISPRGIPVRLAKSDP
jgi:hypothetical protein